ncbi:rCG44041, isoform CRA_a, partial [Rattus norvegicus]
MDRPSCDPGRLDLSWRCWSWPVKFLGSGLLIMEKKILCCCL